MLNVQVIGSFDQANDLPKAVKDYTANIEKNLALIKQIADQLDGSDRDRLFTASLRELPEYVR